MRKSSISVFAVVLFGLAGWTSFDVLAQESASEVAVAPGTEVTLSGEVRWKKAFGTVPFTAGLSAPHSDPCIAFHILVVTADEVQTLVKYQDNLTWRPKEGEFNICLFSIRVPPHTPIRAYAVMGRRKGSTEQQMYLYERGGWSGGEKIAWDSNRYGWYMKDRNHYPGNLIDPQPGTGFKRGFYRRELTPTRSTFITFEMEYVSNRASSSPRYKEPAPPAPKPPFITAGPPITPPFQSVASVYLGWDGGPDNPNVDVWVSVNNGAEVPAFAINFPQQHPVFKLPKVAAIELKLAKGSHYKYVLKAAGKTLSAVNFVVY